MPPDPGNVSAFGLLTVDIKNDYVTTAVQRDDVLDLERVNASYAGLEAQARLALVSEGFSADEMQIVRSADMRYFGQAWEVRVDVPAGVIETQQQADFLAQVEAELTLSPVPVGDARALELVNKTNQFNLNGRRLSEVEFQAALNRTGAVSLLVSYKDKYGPLGKVAVLLGRLDGTVLKIDTWVMSCRAFSRHIEFQCLDSLFRNLEASEIELDFEQTERNGPLQEFLVKLAETEVAAPVRIQREDFMSRKPALFHKLNEVSYA